MADVEVRGLKEAMQWLRDFRDSIDTGREDGAMRAVSAIGQVWKDNFRAEGANNSPWDGLSDLTQAIRAAQGYDPEHPILRRTGDLEQAAVDFIIRAQANTSHEVEGASAHIDYSDGTVVLSLNGVKVENQWGNGNKNLPARPFWYTDDAVAQAARREVEGWLEDKLQ